MKTYFNPHNHTMYSNIRLLDSIIRPENLIDKAIELGLSGLAITEHECISSHIIALKYAEKIREDNPNFKLALGNEIYLTDTREKGQQYYHFILIAKDELGHRAIRELSSTAWFYSYYDRGKMERVPTLKNELKEIVNKYRGHLIATSACLGGELSSNALLISKAEMVNDKRNAEAYAKNVQNFIEYCLDLFGNDFYIECAPSRNEDQILVNKKLRKIAKVHNIPMIVGTDSHFLRPEDRPIHKAYLTSKEGDREVDAFYEYAYLMSGDEICDILSESYELDFIEEMLSNSLEIYDKIKNYSLFHKQSIPRVDVKDYPKPTTSIGLEDYPILNSMQFSDDIQNRYWVNQCLEKLDELDKYNNEYLSELEEEARVKSIIGEKLETNMFQYPNTLQHYIDLIWECGSMVGAGRGSSCAALNHYLMGIT